MLSDRPAYASFDRDLTFIAVNDRLLTIVGRGREEVIGKRLLDVFPAVAGSELHRLIVEAQTSMTPVKRLAFSEPLSAWIEAEVHVFGEQVQLAFSRVAGPF